MRSLYAVTLFVSALLLFLIQPMTARMLLPSLGGSAVVWNTAMVFFQALLLAGYVYAHFSIKLLGVRRQTILHAVLMLGVLALLPLGIPETLTPDTDAPARWLLVTLFQYVALPFFVVSASAPMLQRWFAASQADTNPYSLYAASNVGSMLALLGYPIVVEPFLGLEEQSIAWSAGFGVLLVLTLLSATKTQNRKSDEVVSPPPAWRARGEWVLLAFIPSSMLLAITQFITTDIAAVPLLWVIPLAIYIGSFIVTFADQRLVSTERLIFWCAAFLIFMALVLVVGAKRPAALILVVALGALALTCSAYHQTMVDKRPSSDHLTDFYIWMSIGGVLGGIFNSLVAPAVFDGLTELPLIVALALIVLPAARLQRPEGRSELTQLTVAMLLSLGLSLSLSWSSEATWTQTLWAIGIGIVPFLAQFRDPRIVPIALAAVMMLSNLLGNRDDTVLEERSPYSSYRVIRETTEAGVFLKLLHGTTNHGAQSQTPELEPLPLSYYHPTSPLGQVFSARPDDRRPIVAVGLGVGAIAAYARPEQRFTFFEIDKMVEDIARTHFSFLKNCRGLCDVAIGDGRLLLNNVPDKSLGMLIMDAYSSDSIPVHLVTKEAIALYLSKIADDGLIVFHVSNLHLDLSRLLANIARELGVVVLGQHHWLRETHLYEISVHASDYVIMAKTPEAFGSLAADARWTPPKGVLDEPVWTDDFSNIVRYLRFQAE